MLRKYGKFWQIEGVDSQGRRYKRSAKHVENERKLYIGMGGEMHRVGTTSDPTNAAIKSFAIWLFNNSDNITPSEINLRSFLEVVPKCISDVMECPELSRSPGNCIMGVSPNGTLRWLESRDDIQGRETLIYLCFGDLL